MENGQGDTPVAAGGLSNSGGRRKAKIFAAMIIAAIFLLLVYNYYYGKGRGAPFSAGSVSPAPHAVLLSEGKSDSFTFRNRNILANYVSASPDHTVEVTVDGVKKSIGISRNGQCNDNHCASSWVYKSMTFILEPVVWKQNTMYFETWNTSELYFRVT